MYHLCVYLALWYYCSSCCVINCPFRDTLSSAWLKLKGKWNPVNRLIDLMCLLCILAQHIRLYSVIRACFLFTAARTGRGSFSTALCNITRHMHEHLLFIRTFGCSGDSAFSCFRLELNEKSSDEPDSSLQKFADTICISSSVVLLGCVTSVTCF